VLFALTMFLSAALSFTVQPLVGKRLLPLLGGTPAVWNTCLVFFQAALLAGYLFAHRSATLPAPRQARLHLFVLLLPLAAFAVGVALTGEPVPVVSWLLPTSQDNPIVPLLAVLFIAVGVPFAVLSATAPLLQRWYGDRPGTYALYAASNAGSLLGLLGYPLVVEPFLPLSTQQWAWAGASAACLGLIAVCAFMADEPGHEEEAAPAGEESPGPSSTAVIPSPDLVGVSAATGPQLEAEIHAAPEVPERASGVFVWMALAALPAALLTSVSAVVTSEVAPVPLLWVVPLALYLVSFIIVFARWSEDAQEKVYRLSVPMVLFVALALITRSSDPLQLVAPLHLVTFFLLCLVCHGELVLRKPPAGQLTAFYLSLSAGGVLGGASAALLAPLVFCRAGFLEYPIALILATLVRPRGMARTEGSEAPHWSDVVLAAVPGLLAVGMIWLATPVLGPLPPDGDKGLPIARAMRFGFQYGLPLALAFGLAWRRWRFALALVAIFVASYADVTTSERALYTERNFFGTLRVVESRDGKFIRLVHGGTHHGQQASVVEAELAVPMARQLARAVVVSDTPGGACGGAGALACLALTTKRKPMPLMYYHPTGPIGRLLESLPAGRRRRVGAVGLGCGALAYYARPGEEWTFFEIDPAVVRIARDTGHFDFLGTCEGDVKVVLGDARRSLQEGAEKYDVLILDAFSSDAIPVHLLTREALSLYLDRLSEDGVIAYHVSNRYLSLAPLLARLAEEKGLEVRESWDSAGSFAEEGKYPSDWVVLVKKADPKVLQPGHWQAVRPKPGTVWTDQYSNLLGVWGKDDF
jgi:spermidine synthase